MSATPEGASRWTALAALALTAFGAYLALVLLYEESLLGRPVRLRHLALLLGGGCAGLFLLLHAASARRLLSETRLKELAFGALVLLTSLLGLDVLYSVYLNLGAGAAAAEEDVLGDRHLLTREWIPRRYYPTSRDFVVHKPGFSNRAEVYGDLYHAELLEAPELARELLQRRTIHNEVDAHGFRETTPIAEARIFALGDSFVFGVGVDQSRNWVEVLERRIGRPVYNLGVSGSGPRAHLLLLEHLLETVPEPIQVDQLLWLVFEGNDLEDGHAEHRPPAHGPSVLRGTLLDTLGVSLITTVKQQSLLHRLRAGEVAWRRRGGDGEDPYRAAGVRLRAPLYRSATFGPRLFFPAYVERAGLPRSYVLEHPNRPALEETFDRMAALAERHGFLVTVLAAASAPRHYGPSFEDFPPVSQEPHFLDFVLAEARRRGFATVDLYREMAPYAAEELLFWRDDTHWNERGNDVAARVVATHLMGADG